MIKIERTSTKAIKEYFESPFVSQSTLKKLLYAIEDFQKEDTEDLYYTEKKYFNIGDGVDVIITQGDKVFNDLFYISTVDKPGDKVLSICNYVFDTLSESGEIPNSIFDVSKELILQGCKNEQYYPKWKDETVVNSIIEKGSDYFKELCLSFGKQILAPAEYTVVKNIINSFKSNRTIRRILFPKKEDSNDDIEVKYQMIIYFNFNGVACKAMLDEVIINHTHKTVQPIDIKTMGDYTINFPKAVQKRRYDIQGAFYTQTLNMIFTGYEILPFQFIVESTKVQGSPVIYTITKELLRIGKYGRKETSFKRVNDDVEIYFSPIYGFVKAIENYDWYQKNGFNVTKIIKENNNQLFIDWNKVS